jgi:hypothetical protein
MDKAITTGLLIVISMVMAMMLFNVAYPAIVDSGSAMTNMSQRSEDRLRSDLVIVHAAGELDASGAWQDTNGNGQCEAFIWVKNVGSTRITPIERVDVFFGPEGNFTRIPHESEAGGAYPRWRWSIPNGAEWSPTTTLEIAVQYGSALAPGRYFVKVTLPNGVSDKTFVGM